METSRWSRRVLAVMLPAIPLLLLFLPSVISGQHVSAEASLRAGADGVLPWSLLGCQLTAGLLVVPTVVSLLRVVPRGTRGRTLAVAATAVGAVAAVSTTFLMGYEGAQWALVQTSPDLDRGVSSALVTNDWPPFLLLLLLAVMGCLLTLVLAALALARHHALRWPVLTVLALPVLVAFLPLPSAAADAAPGLAISVAAAGVSVGFLRTTRTPRPPAALAGALA